MTGSAECILAFDTATSCSTVALTRGTLAQGTVLASLSLNSKITHSRRLLGAIDYLFAEAEMGWDDIAGVAVGLGPGSFTGLRIGMATAKGLATAAQKALIGVATLDTLAVHCVTDRLICVVLDARKKEVYTAYYRCGTGVVPERVSDIRVLAPQQLADEIKEDVMLVGDGAVLYRSLFAETVGPLVEMAPSLFHQPSATTLGLLAADKLAQGDCLDMASAVPLYVRASDAELSLEVKKQQL